MQTPKGRGGGGGKKSIQKHEDWPRVKQDRIKRERDIWKQCEKMIEKIEKVSRQTNSGAQSSSIVFLTQTQIRTLALQGDGKGKWFSRPVIEEYPALASQYLSLIERPMDFRTLRKNLEKNIYKKFDEFGSDFKLIFLNAMSFNPATEAIHIWAKDLLKKARIFSSFLEGEREDVGLKSLLFCSLRCRNSSKKSGKQSRIKSKNTKKLSRRKTSSCRGRKWLWMIIIIMLRNLRWMEWTWMQVCV